MSARTIARAAGRMTLTTGRQHRCTSQTVGLHAVNFKRFNARRRAGWAGSKAIIWSTRRLPRVSPYNHNPLVSWYCGSCYNALGNADCLRSSESVVTTQLPQATRCISTPAAAAVVSPSLRCTQTTTGFAHYTEYSGMEGRTESEYLLFASGNLRIFH